MGASLYSLHESNIFGVMPVFSMDASHIFPQSVLAVIPLIVCDWCCGNQSLLWMLCRASLLCGCQSLFVPQLLEEKPFLSHFWCEVGGTGALLGEEQNLSIPPQELRTWGCVLQRWSFYLPARSRCSVRIVPHLDVFLMYLLEEVSSMFSYLLPHSQLHSLTSDELIYVY